MFDSTTNTFVTHACIPEGRNASSLLNAQFYRRYEECSLTFPSSMSRTFFKCLSRATTRLLGILCGQLRFYIIFGFRPLQFVRGRICCGRGDLSPYALLGRFLPRLGPLWRHGGLLFPEQVAFYRTVADKKRSPRRSARLRSAFFASTSLTIRARTVSP